jgi:hypothetical protein
MKDWCEADAGKLKVFDQFVKAIYKGIKLMMSILNVTHVCEKEGFFYYFCALWEFDSAPLFAK